VFIMTLVQGEGPPLSSTPGIERFAGILCGLVVLLGMALLVWPRGRSGRTAAG
jgi:hypothetical protein